MDVIYKNQLYDYYGSLLTEKQQSYFEDYYWDNLTLSEMAENYQVSRTAIHNQMRDALKKLDYYEQHLKLYEKGEKIKQLIEPLDQTLKEKIEELI